MTGRSEFIQGLRDLAGFLEERPDVPVPEVGKDIQVSVLDGDDDGKRATVQAAAQAMGVAPQWPRGSSTHYEARVSFGPIEYFVLAISAARMRDFGEIDRLGRAALKRQQAEAAPSPEIEANPVGITVFKEDLFLGHGLRRPWVFLYTCTGPDGRQFDNSNIKTLRDVLRRRYGAVAITIDDQTAAAAGMDPSHVGGAR